MNFSTQLEKMAYEFAERSRLEVIAVSGLFGTLCVITLLGNVLTLLIVCRNRSLWTPTNMFIASLAFSDFAFSVFQTLPLGTGALASTEWPFTYDACQYQGFISITLATASIMTLGCTAVNRYYRVVRPAIYSNIFSRRNTSGVITATWAVALLAPVPYIASGHKFVFHPGKGFCYFKIDSGLFTAISVSITIGVPFVMICYSYLRVFLVVRQHQQDLSRNNSINAATLKTTKTLFVIVFVFMCCWTPILTIDLIDTLAGRWIMPRGLYLAYSFLAQTSSCVNPLIYVVMNTTFRREYLDTLTCRALRKSRVSV